MRAGGFGEGSDGSPETDRSFRTIELELVWVGEGQKAQLP
jgi:hypothetical protein